MKRSERMCLWCEHFYCDEGSGDYSDTTPGEDPEMSCSKGHWEISIIGHPWGDQRGFNRFSLIDCLKMAKKCQDFALHRDLRQ